MPFPYLAFCPYLDMNKPIEFGDWELGPLAAFEERWADLKFKTQVLRRERCRCDRVRWATGVFRWCVCVARTPVAACQRRDDPVKLYLSSLVIGNEAHRLASLTERRRAVVIANALDNMSSDRQLRVDNCERSRTR